MRLLQFGFNVPELKAWPWDHDEGLWSLWEKLGLETSYQIALELERMKDERERNERDRDGPQVDKLKAPPSPTVTQGLTSPAQSSNEKAKKNS
jgi:hypothetical protein